IRAGHKRLFNHPGFLVGLAAFMTAVLVQSGELGSIDTVLRLQTTHSLWTSASLVLPEDYRVIGLVGRDGRIYVPYGIGQSLLMLPSDMVGAYLARLSLFASFAEHDPGIREIVVSYSTNILVCVLTVLVCFRFLRLLEFTVNQAMAGAFTLRLGTTFLRYPQNMTEHNFIWLLTRTGLYFQYNWILRNHARALVLRPRALASDLLPRTPP